MLEQVTLPWFLPKTTMLSTVTHPSCHRLPKINLWQFFLQRTSQSLRSKCQSQRQKIEKKNKLGCLCFVESCCVLSPNCAGSAQTLESQQNYEFYLIKDNKSHRICFFVFLHTNWCAEIGFAGFCMHAQFINEAPHVICLPLTSPMHQDLTQPWQ